MEDIPPTRQLPMVSVSLSCVLSFEEWKGLGSHGMPAVLVLSVSNTLSKHTGQGAPRGVPLYRTTPFVFRDTEHAANLFALKELGNIYSRLTNPTTHILESRYAQLEGGHPLSGLAVASGTNAIFYAIINLAQQGDNIVSASSLYGGTYT